MKKPINGEDDASSTLQESPNSKIDSAEDTHHALNNENTIIQARELEDDVERNDVVERYQRDYKELMKINSFIDQKFRYCTKWTEFCLATNVVFAITFMIYFMNPSDQKYDLIVFLGEILFLFNSFCFWYGIMAIYQRCPLKAQYFTKLLCFNLFINVSLAIWYVYVNQQVGVIPSAFGSISDTTVLITGRGIYSEKHDLSPDEKFAEIAAAIEGREGCRFVGNFSVSEIPGYFGFDYKGKIGYYKNLSIEQAKGVTLDFVLNHLTFGSDSSHLIIRGKYPKENFTPYDGLTMKDLQANDKISMYTKIVPNSYLTTTNPKATGFPAYQFSARYQKKDVAPLSSYLQQFKSRGLEPPSFQVNYEFVPIHIKHKRVANSYARFFVDALAIVGGIFSVMGMLNNFVLTKWRNLRRL